ncbi:MAG: helix-turn-helix domain-containing protein [Bacteroidetes bacterium]|nr:helix-turn-helix domain-containing protein [Bacteroidota bacterium]
MIDPNTPIACLTVGQFLELQKLENKNPQPSKKELPKYLSPVQLCELVGWKLQTVYQNHHNGKIPGARKVGTRLLFDTNTITAWIEENSIPTKAEKVEAHLDYVTRSLKSRKV